MPMRSSHLVLASVLVLSACPPAIAQGLDPRIRESQARRVAVIEKVSPAVAAVFGRGGAGGGGSGVVISPDGYCLTNFHVTQPCGNFMHVGLGDGSLHDAVLVGTDPVGDVALIRLIAKDGKPLPCAPLGDSDKVQVGDWVMAMGNPFLLATDFTPTITFGIVSGTHRYQYPAGTILEYADCIQTEASINPGNSGGPLFNLNGEVIGINGRGSFEKRGRVNIGIGYAISINQIKNFLGHLRGGLTVDHATLGAVVRSDDEGRMVVTRILEDSDAYRRGLRVEDELLAFAGRPLRNVNQYKNVLGIYPRGWRLPLVFLKESEDRKTTERREALVRLMGVLPGGRMEVPRPQRPRPRPGEPPEPKQPQIQPAPVEDPELKKLFKEKTGFANYYFNEREQERLWSAFRKHGDFSGSLGTWSLAGEFERPAKNRVQAEIDDKGARLKMGQIDYAVEPLKPGESEATLREPPDSGGLLVAFYQYRRLLTLGAKGFEAGFFYGGFEPYYPEGSRKPYVLAEVLNTDHGGAAAKWFFSRQDQRLLGFECFIVKDQDPCEVLLDDYRQVGGRSLPHRITVRYGDKEYGTLFLTSYGIPEEVKK